MSRNIRVLESATGVAIVAVAVILSSCGEKPPPPVLAPGLGPPIAPDPRAIYDLREKCGRNAQEWFHHYWELDRTYVKGVQLISQDFRSHYNERMNKCFTVVNSLTSAKNDKTKATEGGEGHTLSDVLENRDLGEFYQFSYMPKPSACYVGESKCDSHAGFDALVAPFMNE